MANKTDNIRAAKKAKLDKKREKEASKKMTIAIDPLTSWTDKQGNLPGGMRPGYIKAAKSWGLNWSTGNKTCSIGPHYEENFGPYHIISGSKNNVKQFIKSLPSYGWHKVKGAK